MRRTLTLFLCCLTLFTFVFSLPFTVSASGKEVGTLTASLSGEGEEITVTGELPDGVLSGITGDMLSLYALYPFETPADAEPLASLPFGQQISAVIPCGESRADLIFRAFVLVGTDEEGNAAELTPRVCLRNPEAAGVPSGAPVPASKKGLNATAAFDAARLGVSHTVLSVKLNELLATANIRNTVSYSHAGKTYTVNGNYLEWLDQEIRVMTGNGIRVYLRLIMEAPEKDDTVSRSLLFPGVTGDEAAAFGLCPGDAESADLLSGLVRFLARRYSGANGTGGAVADYLLGYEVNSNRFSNYCGPAEPEDYAENYAFLLRLVRTAVRSAVSDGTVFVPLGGNWAEPGTEPLLPADPKLDYAARDFLKALASCCGDGLSFRIAVDVFPSDLTRADVWNDARALDTDDTPILSVGNIGVLLDAADRLPCVEQGVLISDFAVSGEIGTESEAMQASAFLYAYGKAVPDSRITALLWHRQVDHAGEKDLYFGLWSSSATKLASPAAKKLLWSVFRDVDLDGGTDLTPYLSVLPEDALREFPVLRRVAEEVPVTAEKSAGRVRTLYDCTDGNCYGFYPAESASLVRAADDAMEAVFFPAGDYSCVCDPTLTKNLLGSADLLTVTLEALLPDGASAADFILLLTGKDADGHPVTLECAAQLPSGTEKTLSFRVSEFLAAADEVNGIRLGLRLPEADLQGSGESKEPLTLRLIRIDLSEGKQHGTADTVIRVLIVLAVMTGVGVVIFLILALLRRRHIRNKMIQHRTARRTVAPASKNEINKE